MAITDFQNFNQDIYLHYLSIYLSIYLGISVHLAIYIYNIL